MTLRHLKIFITVCECGTMRKASEVLHIAQPAISNTISELEKYYDIVLFDRINQRLVITDAGNKLLIKAKAVLSAFSDFEDTAKNDAESPIVNIGSTLTIGKVMMPKLIKSLKETSFEISPQVEICKASKVEEMLLTGELDFALMEGEPLSDKIEKRTIARDRLAVVCGNGYLIKNSVTIEDLARHPFLVREVGSASRSLLDGVMQERGLNYSTIVVSQSNEAVLEAAKENLGIAVLPYSLIKDELDKKSVREINVDNVSFERNYYLVKHKNKQLTGISLRAFTFCQSEGEKYVLNR